MDVRRRFLLAVLLLVGLLLAGTAGYMRIESWPLRDALYMSVITMSTVGFREIGHLSPAGEWFTIGYIFLSIMFAGFAVATITAFLVQGELRDVLKGRRMQKQIGNLRDHYILCGCGAVGREIVMEFLRARVPFVVVDQHPDEALIPRDQEVLLIPGDATDEETLQRAGVARARGLIAALRGDPGNVFVTLTARQMNPRLQIVARAAEKSTESKLLRAGADRVISPFEIAGRRMASTVLRPNVLSFLEVVTRGSAGDLRLEEIHVAADSELVGKSMRQVNLGRKTHAVVVGVNSADGKTRHHTDSSLPLADLTVERGDVLIALGSELQINRLRSVAGDRP